MMDLNDRHLQTRRVHFAHRDRPLKERVAPEPFLKGPIPLSWLSAAAGLPGKALHVALSILWLYGMKQGPLKLTRSVLERFHVSDDATRDALDGLAATGLIRLERRPGKRALITVVNLPVRQSSAD